MTKQRSKRVAVLTVPKGTKVKVKHKKTRHNPIVLQTGRTRVGVGFSGGKGLAKWVPKVKVRRLPSKGETK